MPSFSKEMTMRLLWGKMEWRQWAKQDYRFYVAAETGYYQPNWWQHRYDQLSTRIPAACISAGAMTNKFIVIDTSQSGHRDHDHAHRPTATFWLVDRLDWQAQVRGDVHMLATPLSYVGNRATNVRHQTTSCTKSRMESHLLWHTSKT